jgi:hypothetical protein
MKFPRLVCQYRSNSFEKLQGHSIVLRVERTADIGQGIERVRKSGNSLFCVIVDLGKPLAEIELDTNLSKIPLAVMAPSVGRYSDLSRRIGELRKFNLRVYLRCGNPEHISAIRILSSLGIATCVDFTDGAVCWDGLIDLSTYALLERAPHAPIDPFCFIADNFRPVKSLEWGRTVFDDPNSFLHLDENGRVALSERCLVAGEFVADSIQEITSIDDFHPIREKGHAWRTYFRDCHECAFCPGWRICLGKFSSGTSAQGKCSSFFGELMDLIAQFQNSNQLANESSLWQL